jgi:uncharacterized protein (DUF305 family)
MLGVVIAAGAAWAIASGSSGDHGATNPRSDERHGQTSTPANVAIDQRFIDDMVPHHEMAVDMAEIVLARGKRPELRELAQAIVTAQAAEIRQMKDWRKAWFGSDETPPEPSHPMPGMDLAAVENAVDVDGAFIDQMILHHQSAIAMANAARTNAQRSEIRDLAARIVTAQEAEIAQMKRLRTE